MSGLRSVLGVGVGLAVAQLVLSTSQGGGQGGRLLQVGWVMPAQWLRSFIDPTKPAIPQTTKGLKALDQSSASTPVSPLTGGLSGTGTPTGTGSGTLPTGVHPT